MTEGLPILAVAAFLSSVLSGAVGMGGGISLLAVMTQIVRPGAVVPIHGVVQFTSNFTRVFAYRKSVAYRYFLYFVPAAWAGVALASFLWSRDKLTWFKAGIGFFILLFLGYRRWRPKLRSFPVWIFWPVGLVAGFLAVFVGATGPFIAPFFLRDDLGREEVVATKAVCQAGLHLAKIPTFFLLGFDYFSEWKLILLLAFCVVLGTFSGRALNKRLKERIFVQIFEGLLAVLAVHLIVTGLRSVFAQSG